MALVEETTRVTPITTTTTTTLPILLHVTIKATVTTAIAATITPRIILETVRTDHVAVLAVHLGGETAGRGRGQGPILDEAG